MIWTNGLTTPARLNHRTVYLPVYIYWLIDCDVESPRIAHGIRDRRRRRAVSNSWRVLCGFFYIYGRVSNVQRKNLASLLLDPIASAW